MLCSVIVSGLSTRNPHSAEEVLELLSLGNSRRTQSPTDANLTSSRSHAVLQVWGSAITHTKQTCV